MSTALANLQKMQQALARWLLEGAWKPTDACLDISAKEAEEALATAIEALRIIETSREADEPYCSRCGHAVRLHSGYRCLVAGGCKYNCQ